ncbi:ribulose-phosphate 3-epimerase [Candidatus Woesearchaeota archaeon]|nr:ribulose-phosphate 3-epimerase [Candidatus Woesearchaeota archaeon]
MAKVSVSILNENFTQEAVDSVKSADMIHFDIIDGRFVPDKTVWADVVDLLRTDLPKDVHLMTVNPEEHVDEFLDAGADRISFHIEATDCPESIIGLIHAKGVKAGIAIKPSTDLEAISRFLKDVEFVLVMSVEPGASGQGFIESIIDKIKDIKKRFPNLEIEVDGGIDDKTGKQVIEAGANILVSDSYIHEGNSKEKIDVLKKI